MLLFFLCTVCHLWRHMATLLQRMYPARANQHSQLSQFASNCENFTQNCQILQQLPSRSALFSIWHWSGLCAVLTAAPPHALPCASTFAWVASLSVNFITRAVLREIRDFYFCVKLPGLAFVASPSICQCVNASVHQLSVTPPFCSAFTAAF